MSHPGGTGRPQQIASDRLSGRDTLEVEAWLLGERIDLRSFDAQGALSTTPLTLRTDSGGLAVVFRYGAVVVFDGAVDAPRILETIRPRVQGAFAEPESEGLDIRVDPDATGHLGADGVLRLRYFDVAVAQVVADVLAKSVVLAHYEQTVEPVVERVERIAEGLEQRRGPRGARQVAAEIGGVLRAQLRTVGRVGIADEPELTWEDPELQRLYAALSEEYDLAERDLVLSRKLDLIGRTAETALDLLHNRRSHRLELYIVWLIILEVVLIVYDLAAH